MIDKQTAVALQHGTELHHVSMKDSRGNPVRCRVTGQCKTWVTRPTEFQLPVKYGLRHSFYITERNAHEWTTRVTEAA